MSELLQIQQALKVKKAQRNDFGKYNYRSCEDILEALKAPLAKAECYVVVSDSIEMVGDRIYVKATATLKKDGKEIEAATGYARESVSKKGMDESQITGAASSYARKYALNGLFAIDDTEDADTKDNSNIQVKPELTPDNSEAWNRAIGSYKANGNLDIVLNHMFISKHNRELLRSQGVA